MRKRAARNRIRLAAALVGGFAITLVAVVGSEDQIAVAGLAVAAVTLGFELFAVAREGEENDSLDHRAEYLARAVRSEWEEEAYARKLLAQRLLPLRWARTARQVMDPSTSALSSTGSSLAPLRLQGEFGGDFAAGCSELARAFERIASGRLVVLGEPGSGKSVLALMLTLGLLQSRAAHERVPVLLSIGSWDPLTEGLDDWMSRALGNLYYNGRPDTARYLISAGRILPILDGLDEIPEQHRRPAINAVNRSLADGRPCVVTCRAAEYEDLVTGGAPVLRRAPVVEVQAIPPDTAVTYLEAVDWPEGTEWRPVFDALRSRPESPVTLALSTPLMISIARTVYQRLGGRPDELLKLEEQSRHAVENALTDRLIDAAYVREELAEAGRRPTDEALRARRWLAFLAQYLHEHGERELIWWRLAPRVLSAWTGPALGILAGSIVMLAVATWMATAGRPVASIRSTLIVSAAGGGAVAVFVTMIWYAAEGRAPGRLSIARRGSGTRLRRGFRRGFAAASLPIATVLLGLDATLWVTGSWGVQSLELYLEGVFVGVALCTVTGIALAAHELVDAPPQAASRVSPRTLLRQDRRSALIGSAVAAVATAAFALPAIVGGAVSGTLLAKQFTHWAGWPDRGYLLVARTEAYDMTEGLLGSKALALGAEVLLPAGVLGLLILLTRAWVRFAIARAVLAVGGRTPWRLMTFLADARDRGLLRQAGGTYQFRHVRLQEHLANRAAVPRPGLKAQSFKTRRTTAVLVAAALACVAWIGAQVSPVDGAARILTAPHGRGPFGLTASSDGHYIAGLAHGHHEVDVWDASTQRLLGPG